MAKLIFVTSAGMADGDGSKLACGLEERSLGFADEGQSQGFVEAAGDEMGANAVENSFAGSAGGGDDGERGIDRDVFIAMNASDLFDEVAFASEIEPPAGRAEDRGGGRMFDAFESQSLQDFRAGVGGDVDAEELSDTFETERYRVAKRWKW